MHFAHLFIAALVGLATLLLAEFGYRHHWWRGEGARKVVHIFVAVQAAFWPLWLGWDEIRMISIALTIGFVVSMRLRLFQSIGSIARLSYGEVLYTLAIGVLTLVTHSEAIYAAAMLHMGLADGAAALVGLRFGRTTTYHIFNHKKSLVGTSAFLIVSLIILTSYSLLSITGLAWPYIAVGVIGSTILENIGVLGLDNLLVPAFIVGLLTVV